MRRMNFDVSTEAGRREERKGRRERLDQHLDKNIASERALEEARELVDKLVAACLPEPEEGMSEDMSPDSVVSRILDPARSQLNRLTRAPDPSKYVR